MQLELFFACTCGLHGLDRIGIKQDIERNDKGRHADYRISTIHSLNHWQPHETYIGENHHDIDDAMIFFLVPQKIRCQLAKDHHNKNHQQGNEERMRQIFALQPCSTPHYSGENQCRIGNIDNQRGQLFLIFIAH